MIVGAPLRLRLLCCAERPVCCSFETRRTAGLADRDRSCATEAIGAHDPTRAICLHRRRQAGFTEADRPRLQARLEPLERRRHPFAIAPPHRRRPGCWGEAELGGEVVFRMSISACRVRHTA
ncbi:hypothetical protein [Amycolatopsis balhimycina]|uniref:ATP dependent DNA ligase n=1 Tax=Amycolatopsis balhimycina TaxID=208443 RepID=UPI00316AE650